MECKDGHIQEEVSRNWVLIETYWNVKCKINDDLADSYCSINRNILECKEGWYRQDKKGSQVLIETYWNVKKETKVIDKSSIKY